MTIFVLNSFYFALSWKSFALKSFLFYIVFATSVLLKKINYLFVLKQSHRNIDSFKRKGGDWNLFYIVKDVLRIIALTNRVGIPMTYLQIF